MQSFCSQAVPCEWLLWEVILVWTEKQTKQTADREGGKIEQNQFYAHIHDGFALLTV
jgi:hypothetical protein